MYERITFECRTCSVIGFIFTFSRKELFVRYHIPYLLSYIGRRLIFLIIVLIYKYIIYYRRISQENNCLRKSSRFASFALQMYTPLPFETILAPLTYRIPLLLTEAVTFPSFLY